MTEAQQFGRYMLTHLLGKGGMASVYRAIRAGPMGFAKEVAIKRIHEELTQDEQQVKALINEARIGGQLRHPNIVEIYEFDRVDDQYYLAMEYVSGWPLERIVRQAKKKNIQIPTRVALDIVQQVCEGLDYAHSLETLDGEPLHLVHRDLKPGNLIMNRKGVVKIMDFGIAKSRSNLFRTTAADVTKGTPQYMSPEQVAGARDLDATSDIFSLGAILFELLMGSPLFTGDNLPAVLYAVVNANISEQVGKLEHMLPGLGGVFARACAKRPRDRYDNAGELGEDVRGLMANMGKEPSTAAFFRALRGDEPGATFGDSEGLPTDLTMEPSSLVVAQAETVKAPPRASADHAKTVIRPSAPAIERFDVARNTYREVQRYVDDTGAFIVAYKRNQNSLHWVATISALIIAAGAIAFALTQRPYQVETVDEALPPLQSTKLDVRSPDSDDGTEAIAVPEGDASEQVEQPDPNGEVGERESPLPIEAKEPSRPVVRQRPKPDPERRTKPPERIPEPDTKPVVVAKANDSVSAEPEGDENQPAEQTERGVLTVRGSTPSALILINGRDIGRQVLPEYPLPPGSYKITLRNVELSKAVDRTIEIKTNATTVVPGYDFYQDRWKASP